MRRVHRHILTAAAIIMLGFALFPPWHGYVIYDQVSPNPSGTQFIGWRFVLSHPTHGLANGSYSEISSGILHVQVMVLIGLTTLALVLMSTQREPSRQR